MKEVQEISTVAQVSNLAHGHDEYYIDAELDITNCQYYHNYYIMNKICLT